MIHGDEIYWLIDNEFDGSIKLTLSKICISLVIKMIDQDYKPFYLKN